MAAETTNPPFEHPADIYAAIRKRGGTFASIARSADPVLNPTVPRDALNKPCYAGEQAIANFLGMKAQDIWPERYDSEGVTLQPRIRRCILDLKAETKSSKNDKVA